MHIRLKSIGINKPLWFLAIINRLFLKFTANELTELSYLDSFGQSVTLEFDEISWKKFDEAKLLIETPEGIDVVYH